MEALISGIVVFVLAMFVGVEIIKKVPSLLHTPLTSGSNAIRRPPWSWRDGSREVQNRPKPTWPA